MWASFFKLPDVTGLLGTILAVGSYLLYIRKPKLRLKNFAFTSGQIKVTIENVEKYFDVHDVECEIVTGNEEKFEKAQTLSLVKSKTPGIRRGGGEYTFVASKSNKSKTVEHGRHVRIIITAANPIGIRKIFEVSCQIKGDKLHLGASTKNFISRNLRYP